MIKVYVYDENNLTWVKLPNAEDFSLVSEIGGRVPQFHFRVADTKLLYSPFITSSPFYGLIRKGKKVRVWDNDTLLCTGYVKKAEWHAPDLIVTVACEGAISLFQEQVFENSWSYESGSFSQSIPAERYITLSSATAVFDVRLNDEPFDSYEWDFNNNRLVITDDTATGTISGKYISQVSPHLFLNALCSGVDFCSVPLINGTIDYTFSAANILSGATLSGVKENSGTGEIITRVIDLGKYTTGFSTFTLNYTGSVDIYVRGADARKDVTLSAWQSITSGTDLNTVFGKLVRFLQFKLVLTDATINSLTISLTGNAPPVEKVVFPAGGRKFDALLKFVECYACTVFEDRWGTLRIEHKENEEDYIDTIEDRKYVSFTFSENLSPGTIYVEGLEQSFQPYGDVNGAKRKYRGKITIEGLTGEETIENGIAWDSEILQNVASVHTPALLSGSLVTNKDFEPGDLVKAYIARFEGKDIYSAYSYCDVTASRVFYQDMADSRYSYCSSILLEVASVFRVASKIYEGEGLWRYEIEETKRYPVRFYDLFTYMEWAGYGRYDPVVTPEEPELVFIWDGESWQSVDFSYNADTGEVIFPRDQVSVEDPTYPVVTGAPLKPIVVLFHKREIVATDWYYDSPDLIHPYTITWDVFNPYELLENQGFYLSIYSYDPENTNRRFEIDHVSFETRGDTVIYGEAIAGKYGDKNCVARIELPEPWSGKTTIAGFTNYLTWQMLKEFISRSGYTLDIQLASIEELSKPWLFDMYHSDGSPLTLSDVGTELFADVYADTGDKLFEMRFKVVRVGSAAVTNCDIVAGTATEKCKELFEAGNIRYFEIQPKWSSDFYVKNTSRTSNVAFRVPINLVGDDVTNNTAQGVWWFSPGFVNYESYSLDVYSGYNDKFFYFFKTWRGLSIDLSFKLQRAPVDTNSYDFTIGFYEWGDGRYKCGFYVGIVDGSLYGYEDGKPYLHLNWETFIPLDDDISEWTDMRIVILGKKPYLDLNEVDPLSEDINYEPYKDAHETRNYYKSNPDFPGFIKVFINGEEKISGTFEEITDYYYDSGSAIYADWCEFYFTPGPYITEGWFMRRLKFADKALRPYQLDDGRYVDIREVV